MHFDPIVQIGIFLVCLGIFVFLASRSVRTPRVERKREERDKHETRK